MKTTKPNLFPIYIIWYREILLYLRNHLKLFTSFFVPILILVFFGTGLKAFLPQNLLHYDFVQFFFPGILSLSCLVMVMSSTISVVWDKEFGFLKEILVAPIERWQIALGKILGATTTAVIEGALILFSAPYFGFPLSWVLYFEVLGIIFLFSYGVGGLGLFFASRISRMESFSILTQLIIAPLVFLSGALFPLNNAPLWMLNIARYNPLAYGIDALHWIFLKPIVSPSELNNLILFPFAKSLLVLIAFDFIISFLALRVFNRYLIK
jgi:ABC-2 type transport system permease protein